MSEVHQPAQREDRNHKISKRANRVTYPLPIRVLAYNAEDYGCKKGEQDAKLEVRHIQLWHHQCEAGITCLVLVTNIVTNKEFHLHTVRRTEMEVEPQSFTRSAFWNIHRYEYETRNLPGHVANLLKTEPSAQTESSAALPPDIGG